MNHLKFKLPAVTLLVVVILAPMLWCKASAEQGITRVNWDSLNLSDDQRAQLDNMDQQWKNSVHELAPRIETNRRKLRLMMNESHPDEGEVMELQQQVHQDKLKLRMQATKLYLGKKRVLNPIQQEKFSRMLNRPSDTTPSFSPASASQRH